VPALVTEGAYIVRTRTPDLQPPPPRLPANQVSAPELVSVVPRGTVELPELSQRRDLLFNMFDSSVPQQHARKGLCVSCEKHKDGL
jgi:hypothetical protein